MAFQETLRNTPEYEQVAGEPDDTDADISEPRRVETPREAVSPVISLERGDVQFWLQVLQVLLLYLILREVGRQ